MRCNARSAIAALLLATLMLLSLAACGTADDGLPENMQYATAEGAHYRLFVPIGWNLMTGMGVSGAYASPQPQGYAAVTVKDYPNPDGLTARDYAKQVYLNEIAAVYPDEDFSSLALHVTRLDGKQACAVEYSGTRDLVTYRTREVLCVHGERVYVLTFCTQKDLFDAYSEVYESIVENFRFDSEPYVPDKPINTVDPSADAPKGMMLASNDDVDYRFYVPDTWVLDTALPTSSAYVSESDRSNVTVTVYEANVTQVNMTAAEYWVMCEEQLMAVLGDYHFVSRTEGTLDGRPSNTYTYSATINGKAYRFAQTVAAYRGGKVYTVTYTALDGVFDAHMDEYSQILAAFDFRGN